MSARQLILVTVIAFTTSCRQGFVVQEDKWERYVTYVEDLQIEYSVPSGARPSIFGDLPLGEVNLNKYEYPGIVFGHYPYNYNSKDFPQYILHFRVIKHETSFNILESNSKFKKAQAKFFDDEDLKKFEDVLINGKMWSYREVSRADFNSGDELFTFPLTSEVFIAVNASYSDDEIVRRKILNEQKRITMKVIESINIMPRK